ncbi:MULTISPECIES: tryptophan--tRNA ligase [unclassified Variovorax]|uniref:tryptophan--tRNA ligase n=1 Tax=unclassified Variovorax TaxID=663243 RepID=UPI0008D71AA4|nr:MULTISPECIES: tryptophan--tRNA ligase [unclassified Variovorax]SEK17088.1 tryptophanyl-tRNA synthetase [Variovorax sp. OK202]SFE71232.1 tryptophanyl-tRNA synthetase [Variovorax sp. OK212]
MVSSSQAPLRVLTGITPSGTPHLGNYVGSIRHSVRQSVAPDVQSFFFLADYHALIKVQQPALIQRSTLEIAASWLACGLDPEHVTFYRQSDIPEIPELTWFLTCVTGKGVLNRAHAYKAQLDKNVAKGEDPDADVTAGLFMYPVLMGADILMFNAHKVPVGRDQVQHIEMARDMAQRFNHQYGEHFTLPDAEIDDAVATLPGLDGRKMSKSYGNTIPLFAPRAYLRKQITSIVTDSRAPGEPKDTEGSALFQIYQAFADADETDMLRKAYADGIGWGDAKQLLFERIDLEVAPLRARYDELIANPAEIERLLLIGAEKARALSQPFMTSLRHAVGLRNLAAGKDKGGAKAAKVAKPSFKQYREKADGLFYFKLLDARGETLLQSRGFTSPQEAGRTIAVLQAQRGEALASLAEQLEPIDTEGTRAVTEALEALAEATSANQGS